ncbi:MAG: hypothetical protein AAF938_03150 [Myxococcota bacterium]
MTPRKRLSPLLVALALSAGAAACGSRQVQPTAAAELPQTVDAANVAESTRLLHRLEPGSSERDALRDRIAAYHASQGAPLLEGDDYDALVAHFGTMVDLYVPQDFGGDAIAPLLLFAARIAELGAPRGDEARVMAARRTPHRGGDNEGDAPAAYDEVERWGATARAGLDNPMERLSSLIEVWGEHARLSPAADVLARLADLHVERRNAVFRMANDGGSLRLAMRGLPEQVSRIAPLDVAAVYLVHGDLSGAITRVEAMGSGPTEEQLLRVMRAALDPDGADALVEIAEAYREARPRVAVGVCRVGARRFSDDARFHACLARVATARGELESAIAWYASAIERAPGEQQLYDESAQHLSEMLERSIDNLERCRRLASELASLLEARSTRFPNAAPIVPPGRVELAIGMAEMHAGHVAEARELLTASLAAQTSVRAHEQLGHLQERLGEFDAALASYRAALDLSEGEFMRASLQTRLGNAFAGSGNEAQARRMYTQALSLWDQVLQQLQGRPEAARFLAETQLQRGVVLGLLDRADESQQAFRAALTAAPQSRSTYATILSFLVTARPDLGFATEIFAAAKRQTRLADEWRVYFALWVRTIAARAGETPSAEVQATLESAAQGASWSSTLARFGAGELSGAALIAAASNPGQQTEAYFYAGTLSEDAAGELEHALDARLVDFYEYVMAQRLLRERR